MFCKYNTIGTYGSLYFSTLISGRNKFVNTHNTYKWYQHYKMIIHKIWTHFYLSILWLKESSNCKIGMRGMDKCRPTVAYWVQIDGINISHWTDYKVLLKRDIDPMLFYCYANVCDAGPALNKCLRESPPAQQTQNICITFIQRRPTLYKFIQMFTRCQYELGVRLIRHPPQ